MTIFLLGQVTPENLTLQGAHSFTTNDAKGSISAASASFAGSVGIHWTLAGATNALTFTTPRGASPALETRLNWAWS